ncbi:heavy-metal-associated domain-containing protein [Ammoniphilus sp. YIM 78166]|uniref:heavy-metal-associated domain-containing protein n=1 Tax=Ammoniphilus sp. YIM 78166 TaxID=1644106 RepID=UPI00106F14D9|nr:heavy metal-associated domain-containing protein [Ammoniphilus sp. YIM 78166]
MLEIEFQLRGLTDQSKIQEVERSLGYLAGVERAMVDVKNQKVFVEYNPDMVDPDMMKQALQETGVEAT